MSDLKVTVKRAGGFKLSKIITAIICITILEAIALLNGINGNIMRIVIAAIAGLAGLATKTPKILEDK